jgi:Cu(I)/Ag(I) efflux system membrane protein CusA/SilA
MDRQIKFPGLTNAWTMPIKTRIDMLSTGIKTPVGIKIGGPDLLILERIGEQIEAVVREVPGTLSAYAERVMGDRYVNYNPDREKLQRYGLTIADVQEVFMTAIGGMAIGETIEGLERYSINLRYPREMRDNIDELRRVLVPTPQGYHIPLGDLGRFEIETGPAGIKSEQARPNAWVYVDLRDSDVGGYVDRAKRAVEDAIADGRIELPLGVSIQWSGQYESMERARERLALAIPLTLLIILVLIYLSTGSAFQTFVVMACLPFSLLGAFWLLYWLDYNLSVAVWVGIIALAGLDAETSQVMLLYLDLAWERLKKSGAKIDWPALREAVLEGAATRLRPKAMTVGSTMLGLLPIMWATGAGADTMKRIAVPMIGGMVSSFALEMLVIPSVYLLWKAHGLGKQRAEDAAPEIGGSDQPSRG